MFNQAKALTGARTFKGVSAAPNRGTVNPKGYLQRELKRQAKAKGNGFFGGVSKVGRDGKSDTRSGIAHKMLQNKNRALLDAHPGRVVKPASPKTSPAVSEPKPFLGNLTISPQGTLNLPFDNPSYQAIVDRKQQLDMDLLDIQKTRQQQALEYLQGMTQAKTEYGQQQQDSLNDFSGRGAAFSSGYGKAVGDNAAQFNALVSNLESQNAYADTDAANRRNLLNTAFNQFLQKNAVDQASNLHDRVGSLGFGAESKVPPIKRKPKPKPKAKAKPKKNWAQKAAKRAMADNRKGKGKR